MDAAPHGGVLLLELVQQHLSGLARPHRGGGQWAHARHTQARRGGGGPGAGREQLARRIGRASPLRGPWPWARRRPGAPPPARPCTPRPRPRTARCCPWWPPCAARATRRRSPGPCRVQNTTHAHARHHLRCSPGTSAWQPRALKALQASFPSHNKALQHARRWPAPAAGQARGRGQLPQLRERLLAVRPLFALQVVPPLLLELLEDVARLAKVVRVLGRAGPISGSRQAGGWCGCGAPAPPQSQPCRVRPLLPPGPSRAHRVWLWRVGRLRPSRLRGAGGALGAPAVAIACLLLLRLLLSLQRRQPGLLLAREALGLGLARLEHLLQARSPHTTHTLTRVEGWLGAPAVIWLLVGAHSTRHAAPPSGPW